MDHGNPAAQTAAITAPADQSEKLGSSNNYYLSTPCRSGGLGNCSMHCSTSCIYAIVAAI